MTSFGDEVDQFRRASSGHLFVAGRFDGMDFKDDECRIVVITTLPRAINLQEEFITSYLRDAGFMRRRLNQRIVQALGRCNRAPEDYGLYFLADQRFATHLSTEANREGISVNIQAEIDLAQDVAEMVDGDVVTRVTQFLQGDFVLYDAELAERADGVPPPRPAKSTTDTSADEVLGWAALDSQNYPVAADKFEACWEAAKADNALELGALHGWHRAKALYLHGGLGDAGARERGLQALEEAITRELLHRSPKETHFCSGKMTQARSAIPSDPPPGSDVPRTARRREKAPPATADGASSVRPRSRGEVGLRRPQRLAV
ncbi:helicase C-terminal domain-containing protein, partial [Enhygromyxa salina]|uniref:helicase C-terminal domain-containing protein n=1 Tax=Enhygromyxa salina TaxID=215803 RepID=UPI001FD5E6AB